MLLGHVGAVPLQPLLELLKRDGSAAVGVHRLEHLLEAHDLLLRQVAGNHLTGGGGDGWERRGDGPAPSHAERPYQLNMQCFRRLRAHMDAVHPRP